MRINKSKILNNLNITLTVCLIATTIMIGLRNMQNYTVVMKNLEIIKRNDEIIKRNDEVIKSNQKTIEESRDLINKINEKLAE